MIASHRPAETLMISVYHHRHRHYQRNITTSLMMLFWKPWTCDFIWVIIIVLVSDSQDQRTFPLMQHKSQDHSRVSCERSLSQRSHLRIGRTNLMKVELLEASNNESFMVSRVCGHLFLLGVGLLMILVEARGQGPGHLERRRISSPFLFIALALRGAFSRPTGIHRLSIQKK